MPDPLTLNGHIRLMDVSADHVFGVSTVTPLPQVVAGRVTVLCWDRREELDRSTISPLDRSRLSAVLATMSELLVATTPAPVRERAPTVVLRSPLTVIYYTQSKHSCRR